MTKKKKKTTLAYVTNYKKKNTEREITKKKNLKNLNNENIKERLDNTNY